jgi:flagellar hook-associated protein FlgK
MIQTQQAFQAASRIITTIDDLLTESVNLVR